MGSHVITNPMRPLILFYDCHISTKLNLNNLTPLFIPSILICNLIHHNRMYPTFYFIGKYFGDWRRKKNMVCVNWILLSVYLYGWKQISFCKEIKVNTRSGYFDFCQGFRESLLICLSIYLSIIYISMYYHHYYHHLVYW